MIDDRRFIERSELPAPYEGFWIDVYTECPMRIWTAAKRAGLKAVATKTPEAIAEAIEAFMPMIAAHNLTDPMTGQLLPELSYESMTEMQVATVLKSVSLVVLRDYITSEAGASEDDPTKTPPPESPAP